MHAFADKSAKCSVCWEEFTWGGVIDGSDTISPLTEAQATCCPSGKHLYCQGCLQRHAQSKIGDLVTSIECPQMQECSSRAWTPKEVAHFVDRYCSDCQCLHESAASYTSMYSLSGDCRFSPACVHGNTAPYNFRSLSSDCRFYQLVCICSICQQCAVHDQGWSIHSPRPHPQCTD